MSNLTATALANPNIALIKYWGNRDSILRIPSNGSISMNLGGLSSQTIVTFDTNLHHDTLILNGLPETGRSLERVSVFLDQVRALAGQNLHATVLSENNFPTGAGIASSASAFASLSLAATSALGMEYSEKDLSRLARKGSGSACRSIPGGFVEWVCGSSDLDSFAFSIAGPEYWDLVDNIAIVKSDPKPVTSTEGHNTAATSLFQEIRIADSERRLNLCRQAVCEKDFEKLAEIVELDSNLLHAVMMTSSPPIFYWESTSLALMKMIPDLRRRGLSVCYTLDAGPNVHVLCPAAESAQVKNILETFPDVIKVLSANPGGPARLI